MPKASTADIKFFKGVMLVDIHKQLVRDIIEIRKNASEELAVYFEDITIEELDALLKYKADLTGISCSDMTKKQIQDLKESSKQFACTIGMGVDAFDNDNIQLNF